MTIKNHSEYKLSLLILPLLLLMAVFVFLFSQDALNVAAYANIQKDCFILLNARLSQFPMLQINITQLGDALILLSLLSFTILYAPKIWRSIISSLLLTLLLSNVFKWLFAVPRPAAVFDQHSFTIIGKTLTGNNSLPSGHSMTVFAVLTVVLLMRMPKYIGKKLLWILLFLFLGIAVAASRVGVGAHYPLDTVVGGAIGYICGVLGILLDEKFRFWDWMHHKKVFPFFIILLLGCLVAIVQKILKEPLLIYFVAGVGLLVSLFKIITVYVKK